MARMIPSSGPRECTPESREAEIYEALTKLPDDYYVVHSLALLVVDKNEVREGEADFVIFHPERGLLVVEAKAGEIKYVDGKWYYGNGVPIHHGRGPYAQVRTVMRKIESLFYDNGLDDLRLREKIHTAVWFPSIDRACLDQMGLPAEGGPKEYSKSITLTMEDLNDPLPSVERILSFYDVKASRKAAPLTEDEARRVIDDVLCPAFDLVPSLDAHIRGNQERGMVRLLEGQKRVLDFISDESFVAIRGASGTGKTLVALEQARRLVERGHTLLFLCYNSPLCAHLRNYIREEWKPELRPLITVQTIDEYKKGTQYYDRKSGRVIYESNGATFGSEAICERLAAIAKSNGREWGFPFRSVIVDEAQDFGFKYLERGGFFESLHLITESRDGCLFLFYDDAQRVNAPLIPKAFNEADTRLSLRINCRNTRQIALCSKASIRLAESDRYLSEGVGGETPRIHFITEWSSDAYKLLDSEIQRLRQKGVDDIVILTCGSNKHPGIEERCSLAMSLRGYPDQPVYGESQISVYSCRRFKGLEADAVMLIDVNADCWSGKPRGIHKDVEPNDGRPFYIGASRAKRFLSIFCQMSREDCASVLINHFEANGVEEPFAAFAAQLGATCIEADT